MAKPTTHLRFLLSLGSTKMVVLSKENDLHIYSNPDTDPSHRSTTVREHVSQALSE